MAWITDEVLLALARSGVALAQAVPPEAVALLLREYAVNGRVDLQEAAGGALARALHERLHVRQPIAVPSHTPGWIATLALAASLSNDERLLAAVNEGVEGLRLEWPEHGPIAGVMQSVEACLAAAHLIDGATTAQAVDELERVVGVHYRPGEGMVTRSVPARAVDQVWTAQALITAFHVTARLPYAMLAEELANIAGRTLNPEPGTPNPELETASTLMRVCCRLAALHADEDYRRAAVLSDADYAAQAERLFRSLLPSYRAHGAAAAVYGLAAGERAAIKSDTHI